VQNLGYMIAASVSLNRASIQDKSAYTTLFAVEFVWPALILLFILIVPESPYYLVSKGHTESAHKQLKRLSNSSEDIDLALERIVHLHEEERQQRAASAETSFLDCFKGTDWRRTRIILYCNGLPQVIGVTFLANGPYFMVQAGLSPQKTAMMIEIGIAFGIASSLIIFYAMSVVGFRKLTLFGLMVSTTFFTVIGIAGCFPHNSSALW
jgi:SP family general alpha glucoside:H+ symporter-like MFS transporter